MTLTLSTLQKKTWLLLTLIVLFGFQLRLQAILQTEVDTPLRADARKYFLYAYNIKNAGTFSSGEEFIFNTGQSVRPDALAPPGFPFFLSQFMDDSFTDSDYKNVLLVQAILSSAVIGLSFLLFRSLGHVPALLIATLTAMSPHLISLTTFLLTETLFCFFFMCYLVCLVRLHEYKHTWFYFFTGVLLGATCLIRTWPQATLLFTIPFLWQTMKEHRSVCIIFLVAGFALLTLPWLLRNYSILGYFNDPTLGLISIQYGMYPDLMYNNIPESLGMPYRFDPWITSGAATAENTVDEIIHRASQSPLEYFRWYFWGKTQSVFSWNNVPGGGDIFIYPVIHSPFNEVAYFSWIRQIMKFVHPAVIILSLMMSVVIWTPLVKGVTSETTRFILRMLSLTLICFAILHIIGAPFPRYSIPIRPINYGLAIAFVSIMYSIWRIQNESR